MAFLTDTNEKSLNKQLAKPHFVILTIICIQSVSGQILHMGRECVEKTPQSPVDFKKLVGQWYLIDSSPALVEWPFICISIKLQAFFDKKSQIKIEGINRFAANASDSIVSQFLNVSIPHGSEGKDGKLITSMLPSIGHNDQFGGYRYKLETIQVLATDYKTWAIVWSCRSFQKVNARSEQVWIISRYQTQDLTTYDVIREVIDNFNLEGVTTRETVQRKCIPLQDHRNKT